MQKILLTLFLIFPLLLSSQNYEQRLYKCFVSEKMDDWELVIGEMEQELAQNYSFETEFELLHAQYGFIAYLIGAGNHNKAQVYIEKADSHISKLLESNPNSAKTIALKGSIIVFRIAISPIKILYLGSRSLSAIKTSMTIEPENIYSIIEFANYKLYAPSIASGSPKVAAEYYLKAIDLQEPGRSTWWYMNSFLQLAIAYDKANNSTLAKSTYERILSIEPNCVWAIRELKKRK